LYMINTFLYRQFRLTFSNFTFYFLFLFLKLDLTLKRSILINYFPILLNFSVYIEYTEEGKKYIKWAILMIHIKYLVSYTFYKKCCGQKYKRFWEEVYFDHIVFLGRGYHTSLISQFKILEQYRRTPFI